MSQPSSESLQCPTATPMRRLGAVRGQRRTPASRTKKPYSRQSSKTSEALVRQDSYKSSGSSGFLSGMRSLVSKLWGTSLRQSSSSRASEQNKKEEEECAQPSTSVNAKSNSQIESVHAAHQGSANSGSSSTYVDQNRRADNSHNLGPATGLRSSRSPAVTDMFTPSPFAYNKRLATASPSVANIKDIERVRAQDKTLSRRHSIGRIDVQHGKRADVQGIISRNPTATPAEHMTPFNARRLLSTIESISTPVLDARTRSTSAQDPGMGAESDESKNMLAVDFARTRPISLRRLPISTLALSSAPKKSTSRSTLANDNSTIDSMTIRRSGSLRSLPRRQSTVPSLARTIQLQQARKAVAAKLVRYKSDADGYVSSGPSQNSRLVATEYHSSDENRKSDSSSSGSSKEQPSISGVRHKREEGSDQESRKRLKTKDGKSVRIADNDGHHEYQNAGVKHTETRSSRNRHINGRRSRAGTRSAAGMGNNVKWRFSARFDPASGSDMDDSEESDEDRDALTSKVPLSRIGGGELIGLSTSSSVALNSATTAAHTEKLARPTGFGSNRMPKSLLYEEPKKPEVNLSPAAPTLPEKTPSKPVLTFSVIEPKPKDSDAESAPTAKESSAVSNTLATSTSAGFSFGSKPQTSSIETAKPTTTETPSSTGISIFGSATSSTKPTTSGFTFGAKPDVPSSSENTTKRTRSDSDDGTKRAKSSTGSTSEAAPAFGTLGTNLVASSTASASSTAMPFSFGSSNADKGTLDPKTSVSTSATVPSFSFGAACSNTPTDNADKNKNAGTGFSFNFGTSRPDEKNESSAGPAAATENAKAKDSIFGRLGPNALSTTTETASQAEAVPSAQSEQPKPAFSFGLGNDNKKPNEEGSNAFSGGFNMSSFKPSAAESKDKEETKPSTEADKPESSTAGFSFGNSSLNTTSSSGPSFTFGSSTTNNTAKEPVKVIDTTALASSSSSSTPFSGFSTAPATSKPLFGSATSNTGGFTISSVSKDDKSSSIVAASQTTPTETKLTTSSLFGDIKGAPTPAFGAKPATGTTTSFSFGTNTLKTDSQSTPVSIPETNSVTTSTLQGSLLSPAATSTAAETKNEATSGIQFSSGSLSNAGFKQTSTTPFGSSFGSSFGAKNTGENGNGSNNMFAMRTDSNSLNGITTSTGLNTNATVAAAPSFGAFGKANSFAGSGSTTQSFGSEADKKPSLSTGFSFGAGSAAFGQASNAPSTTPGPAAATSSFTFGSTSSQPQLGVSDGSATPMFGAGFGGGANNNQTAAPSFGQTNNAFGNNQQNAGQNSSFTFQMGGNGSMGLNGFGGGGQPVQPTPRSGSGSFSFGQGAGTPAAPSGGFGGQTMGFSGDGSAAAPAAAPVGGFQFSAGSAGPGAFSMGRAPNPGSANASVSSRGRRIAQPRSRRKL